MAMAWLVGGVSGLFVYVDIGVVPVDVDVKASFEIVCDGVDHHVEDDCG